MTHNAHMPVTACIRERCDECPVAGQVLCHHTPADLLDFGALVITAWIPFFAGMIRGRYWWGLGIWFALAAVFFGVIEALILCRHCPHYAEEGSTLRCHANWGLPKLPKYDPRPLSKGERMAWLAYVAVLMLYGLPFLAASGQWLLLAIHAWALFTAAWTIQRTQCTRCYVLTCPVNRMPEEVREQLGACYPFVVPDTNLIEPE